MVAYHFTELYLLQQQYNTPLLYEASVGGAIPIIRTLEEYYDNDTLSSVEGILNGTTNYILTKTAAQNKTYDEILHEAQQLGFAESNPKLDVEAYDPKFKLTILIAHAFGLVVLPENVLNYGIKYLHPNDLKFANEKGYKLKLVARAHKQDDKVSAYILPQFVSEHNSFYDVNNEFNAIEVTAVFSDKQLLKGKGAGSFPTSAAVLSDISALRYNYKYGYKKLESNHYTGLNNDALIDVYLRYNNDDIFETLTFETIEEKFVSSSYKYVIGKISIQQLIHANLNNRPDLFVASIEKRLINDRKKQTIEVEVAVV